MARRWQPRQLHHHQVAFVIWNKRYPRHPWLDPLNQGEVLDRRLAETLLMMTRMSEAFDLPVVEPFRIMPPGTRFDAWTPPAGD